MSKKPFPLHAIVWLTISLMALSSCTLKAATAPALTPVTVQLSWKHQAQFAGFYAADQNGYYTAEGLAVTFIEGRPGIISLEPVMNGTAQFGVLNASLVLTARAEGKSAQAIAVLFRRSPQVYVALAESGITRPQDFVDKKIALGRGGRSLLVPLMQRLGIADDQYTVIDSTPELEQLTSRAVDVRSVFLTNEVLTLKDSGYSINIIYPDDYGIHNYGETIITTQEMITANPDLVLRFLRATLKGWTYAIENPHQIAAMVARYNPNADLEHETAQMLASLPLVNTGEDYIGWMRAERWAEMETTLRQQGVITQPLDETRVYTLQFLEEIYK